MIVTVSVAVVAPGTVRNCVKVEVTVYEVSVTVFVATATPGATPIQAHAVCTAEMPYVLNQAGNTTGVGRWARSSSASVGSASAEAARTLTSGNGDSPRTKTGRVLVSGQFSSSVMTQ